LKTLAKLTDEDLLQRMIAGSEDAFTTLYRRRQRSIYRFALQMTGCRAKAEDVTQETFMVLIQEAQRFDPGRGSLSSYLYGIARNCVWRVQDRDGSSVVTSDTDPEVIALGARLATEEDPLDELTRSETIESVRLAVLALPGRYREVIILCDLHEMSYNKAASVLGCSIGTVRSRLHRGRSFLIQKLQGKKSLNSKFRKTRVLGV
jgi:RNA polymerase sigma-70 factor (ECF subfamily)